MDEHEGYSPPSDFLCMVVAEEIEFGTDAFGRANLVTLIALTRDEDAANRDWATMLLVHTGQDSDEIRAALRERLDDPLEEARLEALIGVAQREPAVALPVVAQLLAGDPVLSMALEAAAYLADRTLLPVLREIDEGWRHTDRETLADLHLAEALVACESGVSPEWRETG